MSTGNKILIGLMIVLVVVAGGELAYYFFFQSKANPANLATLSVSSLISPTPSNLSPTPISADAMFRRKLLSSGLLTSTLLTNKYVGVVVEVDTKGGVSTKGTKYQAKLTFKSKKSRGVASLYFSSRELALVRVFKIVGDKTQIAKFDALKVGDNISITWVSDVTYLAKVRNSKSIIINVL